MSRDELIPLAWVKALRADPETHAKIFGRIMGMVGGLDAEIDFMRYGYQYELTAPWGATVEFVDETYGRLDLVEVAKRMRATIDLKKEQLRC